MSQQTLATGNHLLIGYLKITGIPRIRYLTRLIGEVTQHMYLAFWIGRHETLEIAQIPVYLFNPLKTLYFQGFSPT